MNDEVIVEVKDKRRIKSAEDTCEESGEADLERLPSFVEHMNEQMRQNDERLKEYIAAHKQRMAEMDQLRKRLEDEAESKAMTRFGGLVAELLPVLDDFDRAIDHAEKSGADAGIVKGMGLLRTGLLKALTARGLEATNCAGAEFNPEIAQAIAAVPVNDEKMDNVVIEQLSPGYIFGGRVLRPALVRVGKKA